MSENILIKRSIDYESLKNSDENVVANLSPTFIGSNDEEELATHEMFREGSYPDVFRTVAIAPADANWWQKLSSYIGPGVLIAVGYMDPGNWSTDMAAGSIYNYQLLSVIFLSYIMGLVLQALAVKLGIALRCDLAQACRASFPYHISFMLWVIMEIAIAATDLAEVIGSAIALKLLFNIPILVGVCITAADVLILLFVQNGNMRVIELFVFCLVSTIVICFTIEILYSKPDMIEVLHGYIPTTDLVTNSSMLYVGISIIGATVMPHNLFLHSSLVLSRATRTDIDGQFEAIKYGIIDSTISLTGAFFVNSAILIVAASTFYKHGYHQGPSLEEAYLLLDPILGSNGASIIFGIALLASGQSSTFTGTLSGQIVMEGFLSIKLPPLLRRLVTRMIAVVPALLAVCIGGETAVDELLILSQVVLSFALPFAIFPLVYLTSDVEKMGKYHVNSRFFTILAYIICVIITGLNLFLLLPV